MRALTRCRKPLDAHGFPAIRYCSFSAFLQCVHSKKVAVLSNCTFHTKLYFRHPHYIKNAGILLTIFCNSPLPAPKTHLPERTLVQKSPREFPAARSHSTLSHWAPKPIKKCMDAAANSSRFEMAAVIPTAYWKQKWSASVILRRKLMCGTLYVNVDWLFESSAQRGSAYMSTIDAALLMCDKEVIEV